MLGQDVGSVGAPDDDELGGVRTEALDPRHALDRLVGLPQGRAVQAAVQGRLGDGVQVLGLATALPQPRRIGTSATTAASGPFARQSS